ncbi:MAG: EAL domain-containing protein [Stappiaceae bacterium]
MFMARVSDFCRNVHAWTSSLRIRLILFIAGLFAGLTLAMVGVTTYFDIRDAVVKSIDQATVVAKTVSRLAAPHLENHRYLILAQELESIAAENDVLKILVFDPHRNITVDGDPTTHYFKAQKQPDILLQSLRAQASLRETDTGAIEIARPVINSQTGQTLGAVFVLFAQEDLQTLVRSIWQRNALIALAILLVSIPIAYHFGHELLQPIRELTRTAHRVSAGDFDAPFPVQRNDEIGILARAYRDMVGTIRDNMDRIHQLAYVDGVTRLANREQFRQKLEKALNHAGEYGEQCAVLFIDLDRFKRVNDTFGHDMGDILLAQVARRLESFLHQRWMREGPMANDESSPCNVPLVARLGGDEFAIYLPLPKQGERYLTRIARELTDAIANQYEIGPMCIDIGSSIGIARYPCDGENFTTLLKNADMAMYEAKKTTGDSYCFYSKEIDRKAMGWLSLERDLKTAIAEDQLTVKYQPQLDCLTGQIIGVEALVRWHHPVRGLLPPSEFICLAEETGLILELGYSVLRKACHEIVAINAEGAKLRLAVNLSMAQFRASDMAEKILSIAHASGMPPTMLELEITESLAMADPEHAHSAIEPLRNEGIRFAIDDFGTGYSSLAHLRRLPFDVFKIDRAFISGIGEDESADVIIKTILAMAQSLDYETVAEGVEKQGQFDFLAQNGCTSAQGFYFAKPMAGADLVRWIEDRARLQVDRFASDFNPALKSLAG